MKLEHADMGDFRREQYISRVTGQPAAGNPVLKDIDGVGNRVEKTGRIVLLVAIGKNRIRIFPRLLLEAAEHASFLGRLIRLLAMGVFTDDAEVQVYGDYDIGAECMTDTDRNRVDQPAVDQPASLGTDCRE